MAFDCCAGRSRRWRWYAIVLTAAPLATACPGAAPPAEGCTRSEDCESDEVCRDEVCVSSTVPDGGLPDAGRPPIGERVEADELCPLIAETLCEAAVTCCEGSALPAAKCMADQNARCLATIGTVVTSSAAGYDSLLGSTLVADFRAAAGGCFLAPLSLAPLLATLSGTTGAGLDCTPASDETTGAALLAAQASCGPSATCRITVEDDEARGTCEQRLDNTCSHPFDCPAGAWCTATEGWTPGAWGTCQPAAAEGSPCSDDRQCTTSACVAGVCAAPPPSRACPQLTYEAQVLADGPFGFWRFDDDEDVLANAVPGGAAGSAMGAPISAPGALTVDASRSFELDGASALALPGSTSAPSTAITLECWFRRPPDAPVGPLLEYNTGKAFGPHVWVHSTPDRVFTNLFDVAGAGHSTMSPEGTIADNTWYHIAATYDGSVGRLYLDGTPVGTPIKGAFILPTNIPFYAGVRVHEGRYFTGWIDEVAVYDRALTQAELAAHHRLGTEGPVAQPFPWFRWLE